MRCLIAILFIFLVGINVVVSKEINKFQSIAMEKDFEKDVQVEIEEALEEVLIENNHFQVSHVLFSRLKGHFNSHPNLYTQPHLNSDLRPPIA